MTQEPVSTVQSTSTSGVRFTLKKRSIKSSKDEVNLSSYNSDFLTGLFEDVARVTDCASPLPEKRNSGFISEDGSSTDQLNTPPSKKSRTDSISSPYCFRASTLDLASLTKTQSKVPGPATTECSQRLHRTQDSLAFQLNCVSTPSDSKCETSPSVEDATKVAFPNLPATVSDSSCTSGLTRANLVRQASNLENPPRESFGWFVDLDDNQTTETNSYLPYAVSSSSLAFQASTAPKRVNDDAELEWAQAADTVDDVLGDFF